MMSRYGGLALGIFSCVLWGALGSPMAEEAPKGLFEQAGVSRPPDFKALCDEEDIAGQEGQHLLWQGLSSSLEPGHLVSFYQENLGSATFTPSEHGGSFKLAETALGGEVLLEILTKGEQLPGRCDVSTPADAKSMVVLSVLFTPKK